MIKALLRFNILITPKLIEVIFWLGCLVCLFSGIFTIVKQNRYLVGIQIIILGPLVLRIIAENLMIFFKINENLNAIKEKLEK